METMKFYTEEEILDRHIGEKDTPKRDKFEADLHSFLIGEAIKQARQSKNLTQEELGNLIGVQRAQILPDREWEEPDFFYYFQSFQGYGNKR